MSNKTISELTELITPASTDSLIILDASDSTEAKKIQLSNILTGLSLSNVTLVSPVLTTPTITLKQGVSPTPTAEGDIQWDTDDNKIVVGDGAGQKSFSDDSATITNKPLTTPKITTSINDANGNEVIKTPATASAINEVTITNAAAGGTPSISATGDDTNIDLKLMGKGTGRILIKSGFTVVNIASEFSSASTSFVDVTNYTTGATVVVKESSDVEIIAMIDYIRNSGSNVHNLQFMRDSTLIGSIFYKSATTTNDICAIRFVETAVAVGTYTYKLQMKVAAGTGVVGSGQLTVKVRSSGV